MSIARVKASSLTQGLPKKKDILAGNDPIYAGSYESIATVTVGVGGSTTVQFTSIPSTYKHLQVRGIIRLSEAAIDNWATVSGNSIAIGHSLIGSGTAASSVANTGTNSAWFSDTVANSSTANVFNGFVLDILDYANTSKYKTYRSLWGYDANGSGYVGITSNLDNSTTAISTLTFATRSGGGYRQYSSFALYGIN